MKLTLLILLMVAAFHPFIYSEPKFPRQLDKVFNYTVRLFSVDGTPYYGTGYPFKAEGNTVYFVTNAHVLSKDRNFWRQLTGLSYAFQRLLPIEVIAVREDVDLGIFKIQIPKDVPVDVNAINAFAANLFQMQPLPSGNYSLMVAGSQSYNFYVSMQMQMKGINEHAKDFIKYAGQDLTNELIDKISTSAIESRVTVPLLNSKICPPIGLPYCYHIGVRTEGFSGSTVVLLPKSNELPVKVVGLVAAFTPLTERTYVIPADQVLKIANELLGPQAASNKDETGQFEYLSSDKVKYVGPGPHQGKIFTRASSVNLAEAGGGLVSFHEGSHGGGGHEGSHGGGGGHEGSHGGGDDFNAKKQPFYFFLDVVGDVSGYVSLDQIRWEMENPSSWRRPGSAVNTLFGLLPAARKANAVIHYLPGVFVGSEHFSASGAGEPIVHLQDLVQKLKSNPNLELSKSQPSKLNFKYYEIPKDHAGLVTSYVLRKINSEVLKDAEKLAFHNFFRLSILDSALFHRKRYLGHEKPFLNLDQVKLIHGIQAPLFSAGLTWKENGIAELELPDLDGNGNLKTEFLSKWRAVGPQFLRFEGKISARPEHPVKSSTAVASLQFIEEQNRHELKILSVYRVQPGIEKPNKFNEVFDISEDLLLQTVYLPLRAVDKAPKVVFTDLERVAYQKMDVAGIENNKIEEELANTGKWKTNQVSKEEARVSHLQTVGQLEYIDKVLSFPRDAEYKKIQATFDESWKELAKIEAQLGIDPLPLVKLDLRGQQQELLLRAEAARWLHLNRNLKIPLQQQYDQAVAEARKKLGK